MMHKLLLLLALLTLVGCKETTETEGYYTAASAETLSEPSSEYPKTINLSSCRHLYTIKVTGRLDERRYYMCHIENNVYCMVASDGDIKDCSRWVERG